MSALQNRARSALNKLSFFVGDKKAAEEQLYNNYGTRNPLSLDDNQAKAFARSVFEAYGSFKMKAWSKNRDYEPLVPTKGKPVIDAEFTARVYARHNRIKAGVNIRKFAEDE